MIDLQTIITNNTNEEGVINYEKVNEEHNSLLEQQKKEVHDQAYAEARTKFRNSTPAKQEPKKEDVNPLIDEVQSLRNELNQVKLNSKVELLKSKGVNEELINEFINAGADLDKINTDLFIAKDNSMDVAIIEKNKKEEAESISQRDYFTSL